MSTTASANTRGSFTRISRLSSFNSPRVSSKVKLPETPSAPGSALLASMPNRVKAPLPEKLLGSSGVPVQANLPFVTLPRRSRATRS